MGRRVLAIDGGSPIRREVLPYGRHQIEEEDIEAVARALRSSWLTGGPRVAEFEEAFAAAVGARHAVSFSSGTAGLHAAGFAAGLDASREAITTPLTFCAPANAVLYHGARVRFADVQAASLAIDPARVASLVNERTRALLPVDYAGQAADLTALMELATERDLVVIEDACQALGAAHRGRAVGSIAHMTVFSLHPVKHLTTGEGGMVTTDSEHYARRLRSFRNHGIDAAAREKSGTDWYYEMQELGFNYRLPDFACALGRSQLPRLAPLLERRRRIAAVYDDRLAKLPAVLAPSEPEAGQGSWHLYPIRLRLERLRVDRDAVLRALRAEGIGAAVHFIPVHLHPYYARLGFARGLCPVAEQAYRELISLPIFPAMSERDIDDVVTALGEILEHYAR